MSRMANEFTVTIASYETDALKRFAGKSKCGIRASAALLEYARLPHLKFEAAEVQNGRIPRSRRIIITTRCVANSRATPSVIGAYACRSLLRLRQANWSVRTGAVAPKPA